jgi:hypothetical protein
MTTRGTNGRQKRGVMVFFADQPDGSLLDDKQQSNVNLGIFGKPHKILLDWVPKPSSPLTRPPTT